MVSMDIILEAPAGAVFSSGSTLRGIVKVSNHKEKVPAKALSVLFYGKEKTLVRYNDPTKTAELDAMSKLGKKMTESYKKNARAKEAVTSGQINDAISRGLPTGLEQSEVSFYQAMMKDFLKEVETQVKEKIKKELAEMKKEAEKEEEEKMSDEQKEAKEKKKEAEKTVKEMEGYVNAASDFISKVHKISETAKAENKDLSSTSVRADLYGKAGFDFFKKICPKEGKKADEMMRSATEFTNGITGNAHRTKKPAGNSEVEAYRNIFDFAIPTDDYHVITDNGFVAVGDFEVPFSVVLPDSLPSTTKIVETNGSTCRIEYRVVAEIKGSGWFSNYKCKRSFQIRMEPMSEVPLPFSVGDHTTVRTMGLMKQGVLAYAAKVDDMVLDKGETTSVALSFRNTAKVNLKGFEAILFEECNFGGGGLRTPKEHMLKELAILDIPLEDGTITQPKGTAVETMMKEMQEEFETHNDDDVTVRKISFTMPTDAHPTYEGQTFSVRHFLRIRLKTDSKFTSNPQLCVPLLCGEKQEEQDLAVGTLKGMDGVVAISGNTAGFVGGVVHEGTDDNSDVDYYEEAKEDAHALANEKPSMKLLLEEMGFSVHDLSVVEGCVADENWDRIFKKISPKDYGRIIAQVDYMFEISPVAVKIAKKMEDLSPNSFTCAHVVAALANLPPLVSAVPVVRELIPYVSDLKKNSKKIVKVLDTFDAVATEADFERHLA